MYRNPGCEVRAKQAAEYLRKPFDLDAKPVAHAIVLGTGWGDVLAFQHEVPFMELPGFGELPELDGHKRHVAVAEIGGKRVLALRGRIHLNEAPDDPTHVRKVRLQMDMLLHAGVKTLVLTSAAGALRKDIAPGSLVALNGFVQPQDAIMPLWAGEYCNPEMALVPTLREYANRAAKTCKIAYKEGAYAFWRGPHFEGRIHDKLRLRDAGADVVGMSMLPECCVADLYRNEDVRTLGISFITNDPNEPMSHEAHQARAKAQAERLGRFLTELFTILP